MNAHLLNFVNVFLRKIALTLKIGLDETPLLVVAGKIILVEEVVRPLLITVVHRPLVEMVGEVEA